MNFLSRNKIFLSKFLVLFVVVVSFFFYAFSSGITGRTRKNGNGCTCHSSTPSTSVNVKINGPSSLSVGQKATYSLTISGGPLVRAGTNIAASSGTLSPLSGSGLQLISNELTHTSPKTPSADTVTFQFEFTAPASTGNVTLYANGNSVNFNGDNSGDQWNFADDKIIMVNTTSVEDNIGGSVENFKLQQNYPNPFNPKTNFKFQIADFKFVTLKIYDLFSREVTSLVNEPKEPGEYEIEFDASKYGLSSGVYLYQLKAGSFSATKKFVLIK